MSVPVSAREMILSARQVTGTETLDQGNSFVTDAEALAVLNGQLAELYDEILQHQFGDYFRGKAEFQSETGRETYPLLVDIYEVVSVDVVWSADIVKTVKLARETDRNRYRRVVPSWSPYCDLWYRLLGSNIELMPTPLVANLTIRISYIPNFTPLVALTDTFDSQNLWHWFAIWGLAAYIRQKDDDEVAASLALSEKEKVRVRIATMASRRIEGDAPRIERRIRTREDED